MIRANRRFLLKTTVNVYPFIEEMTIHMQCPPGGQDGIVTLVYKANPASDPVAISMGFETFAAMVESVGFHYAV